MLQSVRLEMAYQYVVNQVLREYHKWHSPNLNRDMELLVFGHTGARIVVFPTSMGRFYDWENRGMIQTLDRHISNGWIQLYCVDSIDTETWYNGGDPNWRAHRHLQYQDYIINEVLPLTQAKSDNPFAMTIGASFGAYHAINLALRFPTHFGRTIGMSGMYDVSRFTNGHSNDEIRLSNPYDYLRHLDHGQTLESIRHLDIILPIGKDDPSFDNNQAFSRLLWEKGVWHAFRIWDGNAHDWDYWKEMLLHYIGGVDSKD